MTLLPPSYSTSLLTKPNQFISKYPIITTGPHFYPVPVKFFQESGTAYDSKHLEPFIGAIHPFVVFDNFRGNMGAYWFITEDGAFNQQDFQAGLSFGRYYGNIYSNMIQLGSIDELNTSKLTFITAGVNQLGGILFLNENLFDVKTTLAIQSGISAGDDPANGHLSVSILLASKNANSPVLNKFYTTHHHISAPYRANSSFVGGYSRSRNIETETMFFNVESLGITQGNVMGGTSLYTKVTQNHSDLKSMMLSLFLDPTRLASSLGNRYSINSIMGSTASTISGESSVDINSNGTVDFSTYSPYINTLYSAMMNQMLFPRAIPNPDDAVTISVSNTKTILTSVGQPSYLTGVYEDSTFEIPHFVSTQAMELVDSLQDNVGHFSGIHFADIDPVYNFLSPEYEKELLSTDMATVNLPNIYKEIEKLNQSKVPGFAGDPSYLETILAGDSQNVYWAEYLAKLKEGGSFAPDLSVPTTENKKLTHVFVSPQGDYDNGVIDSYKEAFPMRVDISFKSHPSGKFMSIMRSAKFDDSLVLDEFGEFELQQTDISSKFLEDLWLSIIMFMFGKLQIPPYILSNFAGTSGLDYSETEYIVTKNVTAKRRYNPYGVYKHSISASSILTEGAFDNLQDFQFMAGVEVMSPVTISNLNNVYNSHGTNATGGSFGSIYGATEIKDQSFAVFNFEKWLTTPWVSDQWDFYKGSNYGFHQVDMLEVKESVHTFKTPPQDKGPETTNPLIKYLVDAVQESAPDKNATILNHAENVKRAFGEILQGKKSYSEVLFYRIQKKLNGNTIQNFWLENTPGVDVLKYVDTQVKYGVDYDYRIFAYTLVVGTKYCYGAPEFNPFNGVRIPRMLDGANSGYGKHYKMPGNLIFYSPELLSTDWNASMEGYYSSDPNDGLYTTVDPIDSYAYWQLFYPKNPMAMVAPYGSNRAVERNLFQIYALETHQEHFVDLYYLFDDYMRGAGADIAGIIKDDKYFAVFKDSGINLGSFTTHIKGLDTLGLPSTFVAGANESSDTFKRLMEPFAKISNAATNFNDLAEEIRDSILGEFLGLVQSGNDQAYADIGNDLLLEGEESLSFYTFDIYGEGSVFDQGKALNGLIELATLETPIDYHQLLQLGDDINYGAFENQKYQDFYKLAYDLKRKYMAQLGLMSGLYRWIVFLMGNENDLGYLTGVDVEASDFNTGGVGTNIAADAVTNMAFSTYDWFDSWKQFDNNENPYEDLASKWLALISPNQSYDGFSLFAKRVSQIEKINQFLTEYNDAAGSAYGEEEPQPEFSIDIFGSDKSKFDDLFTCFHYEAQTLAPKYLSYAGGGSSESSGGHKLTPLDISTAPHMKLVEVPVYQEIATVVDDPPLPPDVEFNSYLGDNRTLLINFTNTVGTQEAEPIILPGDDISGFEKIRRKQDRDYTYNDISEKPMTDSFVRKKITFRTDDPAETFQVFRKAQMPLYANDFTGDDFVFSVPGNQASFVDNISPNRKYYYAFRSIDKHGHPSNLTHVYEVELVSDLGFNYLLVDVVDLEQQRVGKNTRGFKRYLQIDPSFLQKLIDTETRPMDPETAFGQTPKLGILNKGLYNGERFKIRVTSRATGRKIDFNIKFKQLADAPTQLSQKAPIL